MADIEVTLGAKNEASQVLKNFQAEVTSTAQSIEFSFRGLAQLAGATAAVVALVEAGRALFTFTSDSLQAFDAIDRSAAKLNETLLVLPGPVAGISEQLVKTAKALEAITNVDAAKTIDAVTGALRRGADPKQIDELAEAAIGLSRVFDRDLQSSMRLVEQAVQGNFEAFTGLIPNINAMATAEEKLAAVSKLAQSGLENKAKAAREAEESAAALHVAMSRLYRTVGELLDPVRDVVYRGFILISDFIVGSLNPSVEAFDDLVKQIEETVRGFADYMLTGFISAFTAAETVVLNFSDSVGIAVDYVSLRVITMIEDVKYGFSSLVGQIQFLANNPGRLMFIGVNQALATIQGMTPEFEALVQEQKDLIAEGLQVPPRAATESEKALRDSINNRLENIFNQYNQKFQERISSLSKEVKIPFKVELEGKPQIPNLGQPEILKDLQAFESRVLMRGPGTSPVEKIAENTAKTAKNTEEMIQQQRETNRIIGVNVSPGDAKFVEVR